MRPRILVIRGGAIGDFVLTLPAIRLLRENFPQAHLEILGYKHIVALAEGRFYADATRSIEYGGLSRFFIPGTELPEDLVEYFASFQQIVSYLYDPDGFFEQNLRRAGVRYFLHGSPLLDDSAHAAQQLAQPLESLALYLEDKRPRPFSQRCRPAIRRGLPRPRLPRRRRPVHRPAPGQRRRAQELARRTMGRTGRDALPPRPDARVLLVGGEADHAPLAHLREAWRGPEYPHRARHAAAGAGGPPRARPAVPGA